MTRPLWFYALLLAACGGCESIPVVPHDPPVNPTPVEPPIPVPVNPPVVGGGSITDAQYDAVSEGALESEVVAKLGAPFQRATAAGMTKLVYIFVGTDHVAWFFVGADGKVTRKSRL